MLLGGEVVQVIWLAPFAHFVRSYRIAHFVRSYMWERTECAMLLFRATPSVRRRNRRQAQVLEVEAEIRQR